MKQQISIVNKSTGKFAIEKINGRKHLVTTMLAIEGDSVMNELFYPNDVVASAAPQLDMLPAPAGHPQVNGKPVSAFNPLAINAHSFGGFTRSPEISGMKVFADLVIDLKIANQSSKGRSIIARIRKGERIGVSTGLIADVTNTLGNINNQEFTGRVERINFDHVAVLLDAMPAGENTFTINHSARKQSKRTRTMDELNIDLNPFSQTDRLRLMQLNGQQILDLLNHNVSVDEGKAVVEKAGFFVNQVSQDQITTYLENEDQFKEFLQTIENDLNETKQFIVDNSAMEMDQLAEMSLDTLESLSKAISPKQKYIGTGKRQVSNELVLVDDINLAKEA